MPVDESSYRTFVASRRQSLRRTAYFLVGDWHLAEDLVQVVLTKLYLSWGRVQRRDNVSAYVHKTLVNAYIDHTRRPSRREHATDTPPDHVGNGDPESSTGPLMRHRLISALADVPPMQRAVLVLRFWDDLSIAQVADVLNCSIGNVKSQTSRGLDRLRTVLGPVALESLEEYR
jgi:RNA polymerase sigma-70 factor (sigma-E family)